MCTRPVNPFYKDKPRPQNLQLMHRLLTNNKYKNDVLDSSLDMP